MAHANPRAQADSPSGERLRKADRILDRRDFLRVQQTGRRVHSRHFVIIVAAAERQRIGITVTKRVANAVGRNRIKRVLREVFRRNRALFPQAAEIVVVARQGAQHLGYHAAREELAALSPTLRRAATRPALGRKP